MLSIVIDSELDGRVDGEPARIVLATKPVSGLVRFVDPPDVDSVESVTVVHMVMCGPHGELSEVERGEVNVDVAKGAPFRFELSLCRTTPSYDGLHVRVVHALEARVTFKGDKRPLAHKVPLVVQAPRAEAADTPWMTCNDFGGIARLELLRGSVLPLGRVAEAKVQVSATSPLSKVLLKLLVVEGEAPPRCVREVVVASGEVDLPPEGLSVSLPLAEGAALACADGEEPLGPSLEPSADGKSLGVKHLLRLVLVKADAKKTEAWNSLAIRLAPCDAAVGAPADSLAPLPPRPVKSFWRELLETDRSTIALAVVVLSVINGFGPLGKSFSGLVGGWAGANGQGRAGPQWQHAAGDGGAAHGWNGQRDPTATDYSRTAAWKEAAEDAPEVYVEGKGWVAV